MGGLGSDRIRISEEEALFLVKYFGNKNLYYEKQLPGECRRIYRYNKKL